MFCFSCTLFISHNGLLSPRKRLYPPLIASRRVGLNIFLVSFPTTARRRRRFCHGSRIFAPHPAALISSTVVILVIGTAGCRGRRHAALRCRVLAVVAATADSRRVVPRLDVGRAKHLEHEIGTGGDRCGNGEHVAPLVQRGLWGGEW